MKAKAASVESDKYDSTGEVIRIDPVIDARKLLVLANILVAQDRLWSQTAPKTT